MDKLIEADFIREVDYPTKLANMVLVKKQSGKWRLYMDFTDLNKACPNDCFPLLFIDKLVDAMAGYNYLTSLDALSSYYQIPMDPEDEEKTAFIIEKWIYCYKAMPCSLKNTRATYQYLINKIFKAQLGRNLEAYVDDMIVKSKTFG